MTHIALLKTTHPIPALPPNTGPAETGLHKAPDGGVVDVKVTVSVAVAVGVPVGVAVLLAVAVLVRVRVAVCVNDSAIIVCVILGVAVGVAVEVAVRDAVCVNESAIIVSVAFGVADANDGRVGCFKFLQLTRIRININTDIKDIKPVFFI
jgi:hypothetical protein